MQRDVKKTIRKVGKNLCLLIAYSPLNYTIRKVILTKIKQPNVFEKTNFEKITHNKSINSL